MVDGKRENLFVNKKYLYVVPMVLVFSGGENGKVFLQKIFDHPREMLRPTDLNPFVSGQAFAIPISGLVKFIHALGNRKNPWIVVSLGGLVPKLTLWARYFKSRTSLST